MNILISNDDGVYAPGLKALYNALAPIAKQTSVIAPDRDRSAASKSLTLSSPIRPRVLDNGFIAVDGTPADCVHLGLTELLEEKPDMVVSGINGGSNLGDDVWYSGTVAAATEGRSLGSPSIAFSLVGNGDYYETAGRAAHDILQHLVKNPLPADTILNVNIPDLPYDQIKGYQVTRLGSRHQSEKMIQTTDPRGQRIYWVGPAGPEQDAGPGTDFDAIKKKFISLTPLEIDLTKYESLESLQDWAKELYLEND